MRNGIAESGDGPVLGPLANDIRREPDMIGESERRALPWPRYELNDLLATIAAENQPDPLDDGPHGRELL